MNNLKFDLNELVSNEVAEQLQDYENQIDSLQTQNRELRQESKRLKEENDNSRVIIELFSELKTKFDSIKHDHGKDGYGIKTVPHQQFEFIETIMSSLFKIKKELNGFYSGSLATNLALNYYTNKASVINVCKILMSRYKDETVLFIEAFKMPYDYDLSDVVEYCTYPKYNTNGAMFGINRYWSDERAGKKNMPHDLIMASPYIVQESQFSIIIETINKRRGEFFYLYALPKYATLSENQIQQLGETILTLPKAELNYDVTTSFIGSNIKKFNKVTLDWLFERVTNSNQFSLLHWDKFPIEYQKKYLLGNSLDSILSTLNHYSCSWSDGEKENLLMEYAKRKLSTAS